LPPTIGAPCKPSSSKRRRSPAAGIAAAVGPDIANTTGVLKHLARIIAQLWECRAGVSILRSEKKMTACGKPSPHAWVRSNDDPIRLQPSSQYPPKAKRERF